MWGFRGGVAHGCLHKVLLCCRHRFAPAARQIAVKPEMPGQKPLFLIRQADFRCHCKRFPHPQEPPSAEGGECFGGNLSKE